MKKLPWPSYLTINRFSAHICNLVLHCVAALHSTFTVLRTLLLLLWMTWPLHEAVRAMELISCSNPYFWFRWTCPCLEDGRPALPFLQTILYSWPDWPFTREVRKVANNTHWYKVDKKSPHIFREEQLQSRIWGAILVSFCLQQHALLSQSMR
jgi:hypothetical protein